MFIWGNDIFKMAAIAIVTAKMQTKKECVPNLMNLYRIGKWQM